LIRNSTNPGIFDWLDVFAEALHIQDGARPVIPTHSAQTAEVQLDAPVFPTNTTWTAANLMSLATPFSTSLNHHKVAYAAVALKISTILPFVSNPKESEKIAVKAPIVPRRLSIL
jgi:hypothetical protein